MSSRWNCQGLLAIAAILCVAVPGAAQETIQGRVISEKSHLPIGSAQVSLVDDSGHVVARALSDSALGAFYLDAPRRGRYAVTILIGHGGFSRSPTIELDSNQVVERTFAIPEWPPAVLEAYLPDDVTKPAAAVRGGSVGALRYPNAMRVAGRGGLVRASFVVGRDGRADMSTFIVVTSDDQGFVEAVREMVSRSHYAPAERDGVIVPQVFEQSVDFRCGNDDVPRATEHNGIAVTAFACQRKETSSP